MPSALLDQYHLPHERYDEMLTSDGAVRAHWRVLLAQLEAAGDRRMQQRIDFVRRQIAENGVTYNLNTAPLGCERPWQLDPMPLVLDTNEWRRLATAVIQRATVFDRMLADLYGPQTLLKEGFLPPGMIYGHPDFLWPCEGLVPPHGRFLHNYAVDLVRSPDGRWWVIADRTQAPSGAGYALENRLIVSRAFPELYDSLKVQHLADFFRSMRQGLVHFSPETDGPPLVVLLTPGPFSETYFEHAYLARYLGLPLVEGQDLTVRGETVYLKTLTGLQRVHGILRRMHDNYCDPLELRGDSALGVPGLLQAARAGRVMIANALGSGLVESASMLGFLPGICRRLLGEPLAMPSVATWWCGESPALEHVLAHFEQMVIKTTYPSTSRPAVLGCQVTGEARERLVASMRRQPRAYVAQELINVSQAPVASGIPGQMLRAHAAGIRLYATATPDGSYTVMPGALSRVAGDTGTPLLSMQRGGISKDTWVLSDAPVSQFSMLKVSITSRDLVRSPSNLSSRIVENLFWFGRYAARCDGTARLLRVALARFDDASPEAPEAREAALDICRELELLPSRGLKRDTEGLLLAAITDEQLGSSLAANLRRLRWTATQVREHLSLDNWMTLNRFDEDGVVHRKDGVNPGPADALAMLDRTLTFCAALAGFAMDRMTRDNGWRFLMIGRHLERLAFLASTMSHVMGESGQRRGGSLDWLLETADSIITYRSRYRAQPELLPVLDLIVFDDTNPHGVVFQMVQLIDQLNHLSDSLGIERAESTAPMQSLLDGLLAFDLTTLENRRGGKAASESLAGLLAKTARASWSLCDRLAMRHFTHVDEVSRQTLAA
jgi:uncharacterized circularly permuted ATP-grasp superfamily protein/uncharacterized alpha-E superfamily protein